MSVIACDTERFRSDLLNCREQLRRCKDAYTRAMNDKMMLSLMWQGTAHLAFMNGFGNDLFGMENCIRNMNRIVQGMEETLNEYSRAENDVSSVIRSLP